MAATRPALKYHLINPIKIKVAEQDLDLQRAKDIADEKAKSLAGDPMLLAWYRGETGEFHPKVECSKGDKPAWIIYAASRGGDITIDINEEAYVFIYLSRA